MEIILAPQFRWSGNCKQGLYFSCGQSSILQTIGCDTRSPYRTKFSRYYTRWRKRAGFKKLSTLNRWHYRFLHFAEKIPIPRREGDRCYFTGNTSAARTRGRISVFYIEDYAGRTRGAALVLRGRKFRVKTKLPEVDERGRGFCNEVW